MAAVWANWRTCSRVASGRTIEWSNNLAKHVTSESMAVIWDLRPWEARDGNPQHGASSSAARAKTQQAHDRAHTTRRQPSSTIRFIALLRPSVEDPGRARPAPPARAPESAATHR